MTKLKEEILNAMNEDGLPPYITLGKEALKKHYASQVVEVAKKYIEKALRDGSVETFTNSTGLMKTVQDIYVKAWLKENIE